MKLMKYFFFLVLLLVGPGFLPQLAQELSAHPHLWIDAKLALLNDTEGVSGVRVDFLFDEGFSLMLLSEVKPNKAGFFEGKALTIVKEDFFDNLSNYDYFLYAELNKAKLAIPKAKDFSAKLEGTRIRYTFTLPLRLAKKASQGKSLSLAIYDESFYTAIDYSQKDAFISITPENRVASVQVKRQKRPDKAFMYGSVVPEYFVLTL